MCSARDKARLLQGLLTVLRDEVYTLRCNLNENDDLNAMMTIAYAKNTMARIHMTMDEIEHILTD
mgnify:FL=1